MCLCLIRHIICICLRECGFSLTSFSALSTCCKTMQLAFLINLLWWLKECFDGKATGKGWEGIEKCPVGRNCSGCLFFSPLLFPFLVTADWDILQQDKLIFSFIILLLKCIKDTLQHHLLPVKATRQQCLCAFHQGIVH